MEVNLTNVRNGYFEDDRMSLAFRKSLSIFVAAVQKSMVSNYSSPENSYRLRHGGEWERPGLPNAIGGDIKEHSTVANIPFKDIVNHDLGLIDRFVQKIVEGMTDNFFHTMYSTLSSACEKTGNTVDAKAIGSMLEAFAEMIERVEFFADKFGNVTLPTIHAGPEALAALRNAFENAPPEFQHRVEEIKNRKIAEAIHREINRKARFVCYGE